jgi:hypothetical protein
MYNLPNLPRNDSVGLPNATRQLTLRFQVTPFLTPTLPISHHGARYYYLYLSSGPFAAY